MSLEKWNTKAQRYEDTKSEDEISHQIIGASIEVHRILGGPGLLESIYEAALCHELILRGLRVHRQRPVQVIYKGVAIRESLFIDVVVETRVATYSSSLGVSRLGEKRDSRRMPKFLTWLRSFSSLNRPI